MNEHGLLRDRLAEEERRNAQLQQFIKQLQQQNSSLMTLAVSTSNSSNLGANQLNGGTNEFDSNHSSSLLIEAKDSRMKQLEIQVQQLQDELNATKTSISRNNLSNESSLDAAAHSTGVSPQHSRAPHQTPVNELQRANEKFFKEKIESLKFELSRKETELEQLKTKYETCESKERDLQHYLTLLKESIATKDQQITMQQSEVNDLRTRLREKETFIEKKNQQLQTIQLEKHQRDSDIGELRDQMDIKERKINVLNRKIDNLEEQLKDKEMQINTLRSKLTTNSSSMFHSNVMQTLEQTLEQKEKQIEKLTKEAAMGSRAPPSQSQSQSQSRELELAEQIETLNISIKELNDKVELKNKEIQDYQNEIFDLKDEVESFKTQLLRKDSHVNSLELSLTQKNDEIEMIEEKLQRVSKQQQQQHQQQSVSQSSSIMVEVEGLRKQCGSLQKEVHAKETQIQQLTTELITLKELIDDFEEQKQVLKSKLEQQQIQFGQLERQYEQTTSDFEAQIKQQQRVYDEQIEHLKKSNQNLSQVNAANASSQDDVVLKLEQELSERQSLYEAELAKQKQYEAEFEKQRQYQVEIEKQIEKLDGLEKEIEFYKNELIQKDEEMSKLSERIKELEDALRESVSITAEREYVVANQKKKSEKLENENKELQMEIEVLQKSLHEQQLEFNRYQEEFGQREEQLNKLEEEKVKEMNELYITKQEILLSTISEKDAVIGSLEFDRSSDTKANQARIRRLNEEKDYLHQQLKDLNEKRMKLMQDYMAAKDAKDKVKLLTLNSNQVS
jgi:ELKS/RAB6-interacting/CAST family protein 1